MTLVPSTSQMLIIYLTVFYGTDHFRILLWRQFIPNLEKKELNILSIDKTSSLNAKKVVYYSFAQFKWKSHSTMLQDKLSHFIGWGSTDDSSEANTALYPWHYWMSDE